MAALIKQLDQQGSMLTGLALEWPPALAAVPLLALGVASVSALLPALEAYRVSVLELLQNP
jgi:ABC-type lipoprotein release transport system permease subunit